MLSADRDLLMAEKNTTVLSHGCDNENERQQETARKAARGAVLLTLTTPGEAAAFGGGGGGSLTVDERTVRVFLSIAQRARARC